MFKHARIFFANAFLLFRNTNKYIINIVTKDLFLKLLAHFANMPINVICVKKRLEFFKNPFTSMIFASRAEGVINLLDKSKKISK